MGYPDVVRTVGERDLARRTAASPTRWASTGECRRGCGIVERDVEIPIDRESARSTGPTGNRLKIDNTGGDATARFGELPYSHVEIDESVEE